MAADDVELDENGDTVSITADTKPFETALDRAGQAVGRWASGVSGRFAAVGDRIQKSMAGASASLAALNKRAAETGDAAGVVGGTIGEMIGSRFGPVGTAIGKQLGEAIADGLKNNFDIDIGQLLTGGDGGFGDAFKGIKDDAEDTWNGIKFSFRSSWDELKEVARGLNLRELLSGTTEEVEGRFTELGNNVGNKIRDMFSKVAARIADFINRTFDLIREPLAKVAEWLQGIFEKLGIVEKGTQNWGDAIRQVEDVGRKVFGALAYAAGVLRSTFVVIGGTIVKYIHKPLTEALKAVIDFLSDLALVLKDLDVMPETMAKVERGLRSASGGVAKLDAALTEFVAERDRLVNVPGAFLEKARQWQKDAMAGVERGRELVALEEPLRRAEEVAMATVRAAAEWAKANAPKIQDVVQSRPITAQLAGSREAVRTILADVNRQAPPNDPAKRAAAGIDKLVGIADKQLKAADVLNGIMKQIKPLEVAVI